MDDNIPATPDEGDIDIDMEDSNYKMVSLNVILLYTDNTACMRAIQMYSCANNGLAFLFLYLLHSCVYPNISRNLDIGQFLCIIVTSSGAQELSCTHYLWINTSHLRNSLDHGHLP